MNSNIDSLIASMTLEEKIGQCLVIGFVGSVATPEIFRRIHQYHPAGIRVGMTMRTKTAVHDPYATSASCAHRVIRKPKGTVKDFIPGIPACHCTNEEWTAYLNSLKKAAMENPTPVPIHITVDMEGENSADYPFGGIHFFPSNMGIGTSGDPELARRISWAVGRQLTALGVSWIHSPVLDVNTNPKNPEIGTRSYNSDFETAALYAEKALQGFREAGIITTGKHFPGRGASTQDAHGELPVIDLPEAELRRHLLTFKRLIDNGLPCIMTAHTAYPAYDPSGRPATLSKKILTDLLKGELGFKGTVTTDDITMGGIVAMFEVADACIEALCAGADLILFRDESNLLDEVFPKLVEAVKSGRLPLERVEDAVRRTLTVKKEYGLLDNSGVKDLAHCADGIHDPEVAAIEKEAAEKTVRIVRNDAGLLPLPRDKKILLIEQIAPLYRLVNSQACHPGLLWEKCYAYNPQVGMVETEMSFTDSDRERVMERLDEADIIVATNYYYRRGAGGGEFIRELAKKGKKLVVVTNSPYLDAPEFTTEVISFGNGPRSAEQIAKVLFE